MQKKSILVLGIAFVLIAFVNSSAALQPGRSSESGRGGAVQAPGDARGAGGSNIGATVVDDPNGAKLESVESSGRAARFGLQKGDIVLSIDDQKVTGAESFNKLISGVSRGAAVSIEVLRDNEEKTVGREAIAGGGRSGAPSRGIAARENLPLPADETEKHILSILDELNQKRDEQKGGSMNVAMIDGRILRTFAEAMNAKRVVELGTNIGYSGLWFCLALRKTGGKLITYEIDEGRAAEAEANFKRAGVDKIATVVLGDAHETVTKIKDPIDIVFLDADKEGYTDYLDKLLPLVRPGGLILTSNTDIAPTEFIKKITTDPRLETIHLVAQAGTASDTRVEGVTVTLKKR